MPRIMISATGTNCGKTSIVCGLLKILKDRGMNVINVALTILTECSIRKFSVLKVVT
jgi:dethiobiotin synthetase